MERLRHLDIELKIERQGEQYSAKVLRSPAGEASGTFVLPFSDDRLEVLVLRLGRPLACFRSSLDKAGEQCSLLSQRKNVGFGILGPDGAAVGGTRCFLK
jgi:hypothetical protein